MKKPKSGRCVNCDRAISPGALFCSHECYEADLVKRPLPMRSEVSKLSGTYQFYLHCSRVRECGGGVQGMDRDTPADAVWDAIDQARFSGWTVTADKALCPGCARAESVVGAMTGGAR